MVVARSFQVTYIREKIRKAEEFRKVLGAQNGIRVVRAALPRKAKNKVYSPLYVAVILVTDADKLCREGLYLNGSWHPYEPFCEGA